MPNDSEKDPQDIRPHHEPPVSQDETGTGADGDTAKDPLEEFKDAPALEVDEDSLVAPENS
ncbi:hypothetical protein D6T63_14280 [Arthrobacter cheniae]|uniref:Uncharacterized protein n=1 Tax=Arthrobacter cheniae TaxID=1258888 RepID=A0A3A5M1S1_9MICC|nr:hypothetical protein [Arthrobacter cheniae]RJT78104.1 hypothetical protein D6T63_14280 [Arthrobacter cheniae]